jgi:c-di-GMP-related signal transduction protein
LKRYYLSNPTIQNRIKLTQSSILLTEKILNSLAEESYLIRLITTDSLLAFSKEKSLSQSLESIHAALIHRNKNNLQLMLNILAITSLNQAEYEELAEFYMNHQQSEMMLRTLMPKISIERCRMCLLTV